MSTQDTQRPFGRLTGSCSDEEQAQFTDVEMLRKNRKNMLELQRPVSRIVELAPSAVADAGSFPVGELSEENLQTLRGRAHVPGDLVLRAIHTRMARMRPGTVSGGAGRLATQQYTIPSEDGRHSFITARMEFALRSSLQQRKAVSEVDDHSRASLEQNHLAFQSSPGVALMTFAPNESVAVARKPSSRFSLNLAARGVEETLTQVATGLPKYIAIHTAIFTAEGALPPIIDRVTIKCKHERTDSSFVRVHANGMLGCACFEKAGGIEVREFMSMMDQHSGQWVQTSAADEYELQLLVEPEQETKKSHKQHALKRKRAEALTDAAACLLQAAADVLALETESDGDDNEKPRPAPALRACNSHSAHDAHASK
jgi:hypothetical protein